MSKSQKILTSILKSFLFSFTVSGGIYLDLDIVFVRSIEELRQHDLTMGLMDKSTGMGNGLILAKPSSRFLTFWYESYRTFDNSKWGVHSMQHPYLLSVVFPDLIHVEQKRIYSPNWFEIEKLFVQRVPWNQNFAVHIWHRHKYPIPKNFKDLAHLNTTLGEILRYIYYRNQRIGSNLKVSTKTKQANWLALEVECKELVKKNRKNFSTSNLLNAISTKDKTRLYDLISSCRWKNVQVHFF